MRILLALLAGLAAAPLPALGQVVSERAEAVSIVVYPELYGLGLVMVTETRTVDLPAGPARIELRGVADQIVPQTVALQGLPEDVAEQNFDYQLLSRGSLIRSSEGRTVTLVRTNPANGEVTQERARVVSGSNGALLDIGGRIEALQCSALPERLVFDDLPPGFVARPTLSVDTVSPRAGRVELTLSYLATGVSWRANYVARLAQDGETLDLSSWITLRNQSDTTFADAPVQVIAGRLERNYDTRPTPTPVEYFNTNCWQINSGRFVPSDLIDKAYDMVARGGGANVAMAPPPPPPPPAAPMMLAQAEVVADDLGDYKLYSLPEPTTLAARQTKQLQMFDRDEVSFDRVYRRSFTTSFEGGGRGSGVTENPVAANVVLELENERNGGLGLPLPAGDVVVFEPARDGSQILVGQPSIRDTAVDLPFELALAPSAAVFVQRRIVRRSAESLTGGGQRAEAQVEVIVTNAGAQAAQVQIREQGGRTDFQVGGESHAHTLKDGNAQWQVTAPAGGSVTLSYSLAWRE